jgi:WD40 repeat protein
VLPRRHRLIAGLFIILLVEGSLFSHSGQQSKNQDTANSPKQEDGKKAQPLIDEYGDPLPYGAIARLGTARLRHAGRVTSLTFSPDSKLLFSGGSGDVVRSWQLPECTPLRTFDYLNKYRTGNGVVAVSPDGKKLAIGSIGFGLWNGQTGKLLRTCCADSWFYCVVFSPDGKKVAGVGTRWIHIWDVEGLEKGSREEDKEGIKLDTGLGGKHEFLLFCPDNKTLISGGSDNIVRFWDLINRKEIQDRKIPFKEFAHAKLSQETGLLAVSDHKGTVRIFDFKKGELIRTIKSPSAWAIGFTPSGKSIAIAEEDAITFWDIADGSKIKALPVPRVDWLAISPDGRFLAACNNLNSIRVWDLKTGQELLAGKGHDSIGGFAVSPNGKKLAVGTYSGVHLWDLPSRKKTGFFPNLGPGVALSSNADLIFCANMLDSDDSVEILGIRTSSATKEITIPTSFRDSSAALGLSSDGKWLFSWLDDLIYVWDARKGKLSCRLSRPPARGGSRTPPAFAPGKAILAIGEARANEYIVRFLDVKTGSELPPIKKQAKPKESFASCSLCFSPDGKTLAVTANEIDLWEVSSRRHLRTMSAAGRTNGFSVDGKVLALSSNAGVLLYEIATGGQIGTLKAGIPQRFPSFLPDGRTLVSASADNSVLLWDWLKCARAKTRGDRNLTGEPAWNALASESVPDAYQAIDFFVQRPKEAISLLAKKLRKGHPLNKEAIRKLVLDLDDSRFKVRKSAGKELEKLGPVAEPFLQKALTESKFSLEGRKRIGRLLALLKSPAPEWLRSYRAIQALELIDLPEAGKILQALGEDSRFDEGLRSLAQADAAEAALSRWKTRTNK